MAANYAEQELDGRGWDRKCVTLNLVQGKVQDLVQHDISDDFSFATQSPRERGA